jgi:hypothetical protein
MLIHTTVGKRRFQGSVIKQMQSVRVNLNPRAVAAPVQRVATTAAQTVAASLAAFAEGELQTPTSGTSIVYQFRLSGREPTSDERRAMYQNWLLCNGLEDLARGVRESLEAAFVYANIVAAAPNLNTVGKFNSGIEKERKRAQRLSFTDLLDEVSAKLTAPLLFEAEMRSLQAVRNCLEHRGGVVSKQDLKDKAALELRFTRRRMFYKCESGEEIECVPGQKIENPAKLSNAPIMLGAVAESRSFRLGETVTLIVADFNEITANCNLLGDDLVAKLPPLAMTS